MKVTLKTKNKGVKHATYPCRKCSDPIKAGDQYYEWQHRHAPPSRQHAKHGRPRQSELCTGKMSGVYAAIEAIEDAVSAARESNDISGLADTLREQAQEVENVRDEYQSSLDNMPEPLQQGDTGQQIQEKIDALDSFADELNSAADEVETTAGELDSLEEPAEVGDEHTPECPVTAVENGDAEEGECSAECGHDDREAAMEDYESEINRLVSEATERAEQAAGELSI